MSFKRDSVGVGLGAWGVRLTLEEVQEARNIYRAQVIVYDHVGIIMSTQKTTGKNKASSASVLRRCMHRKRASGWVPCGCSFRRQI